MAGFRPFSPVALQDRPGGGKARATVQVGHALRVPRPRGRRLERLPGPGGVVQWLFVRRSHPFDCLSVHLASWNFN